MDTMTHSTCWIYKPAPMPNIWQGKHSKWYSSCPVCHSSRSHRTRGLAIDKGNDLCRKCRIERGSDYWAMLRLIRQEKAAEAKQAMEDEKGSSTLPLA
jgi:hypothetical protein